MYRQCFLPPDAESLVDISDILGGPSGTSGAVSGPLFHTLCLHTSANPVGYQEYIHVTWKILLSFKFEPPMTKPTKWSVRPAKTQISLSISPVWSESLLSAWRKLGSLATHWAQAKTLIRLGGCPGWSESLLGAQSFYWFCNEAAHLFESNVLYKLM